MSTPNAGYPYLDNTKADHRLVGGIALMNPFMDHVSSQRGMMLSNHIPQAQVLRGSEPPRIFSGYESQVGKYEMNTTRRDQDIYILDSIPKFEINAGAHPLVYNPSCMVIYTGADDGKIGCFEIKKFTMTMDDFGYTNKLFNSRLISPGNLITKDTPLCTSPSHKGNRYCMGTNLHCAYMSLPHVTEDAFIISESAAQKLYTEGFRTISIDIKRDQIPVNLYGNGEDYKFFPDIGEEVNEDGIICALRRPTADSLIVDMNEKNLSSVFRLHDNVFYAPKGAVIVDVEVHINRKSRYSKTLEPMFAQAERYRAQISNYYKKIWDRFQEITKFTRVTEDSSKITPEFSSVVSKAVSEMMIDGVKFRGFSHKASVIPVKKKEPIEFMRITLTYRYERRPKLGYKISGRYGN